MVNASSSSPRHFGLSRSLLLGIALAALFSLALAAGPSRSHAATEPFKIEFDQSDMKIGLLSDLPLGDLASTGSIEGTIDDQGNVVVPKDKFLLPQIGITDPVNIKIFMGIESDATGTFDEKTGKLVLNAKAGVWLSVNVAELLDALQGLGIDLSGQLGSLGSVVSGLGDLTCGFSPMDVSFSTDNEGGAPFTKGVAGPGAITADWSQLGPFAGKTKFLGFVDVCALIKQYAPTLLESLVGSQLPGGIDLGNLDIASLLDNLDNVNLGPSSLTLTRTKDDVVIPEPPAGTPDLKLSVKSSKKRIKAGKKAEFTVKVKNAGEAAATGVKICIKSTGPVTVQGRRCRTLGQVMAGATQTRRFKVKANKGKKKSVKVSFSLKSSNATGSQTGTRIQIQR